MPYISCVCRILKWKIFFKCSLQIHCNPLQSSNDICYSRKSATVHTEVQSSQTTTRLLIKYNTVTSITLADLNLYYRATVTTTVQHWNKNRHIHQWNTIEDPKVTPCNYNKAKFCQNTHRIWGYQVSPYSAVLLCALLCVFLYLQ